MKPVEWKTVKQPYPIDLFFVYHDDSMLQKNYTDQMFHRIRATLDVDEILVCNSFLGCLVYQLCTVQGT